MRRGLWVEKQSGRRLMFPIGPIYVAVGCSFHIELVLPTDREMKVTWMLYMCAASRPPHQQTWTQFYKMPNGVTWGGAQKKTLGRGEKSSKVALEVTGTEVRGDCWPCWGPGSKSTVSVISGSRSGNTRLHDPSPRMLGSMFCSWAYRTILVCITSNLCQTSSLNFIWFSLTWDRNNHAFLLRWENGSNSLLFCI